MSTGSSRLPVSTREAKEQAAEYFGFTASAGIRTNEGRMFEIPNPAFLDDDQQDRYEEMLFDFEDCDKEQIVIPAHVDEDGVAHPEKTVEGDYIKPYRKNGVRMTPTYATRLAMALFGDDYEAFKAAGGSGNHVQLEWARMNKEYTDRAEKDSKSGGSPSAVEAVSAGDRG